MNMKHTQGPWKCYELGDEDNSWQKWSIVGNNGPLAYGGDTTAGPQNSKANAKIIAAAPEMLQALKDAHELLGIARKYFPKSIKNRDTFDLENIMANSVNNAIRKATAE